MGSQNEQLINDLLSIIQNTENNNLLFNSMLSRINDAFDFKILGLAIIDHLSSRLGVGVGIVSDNKSFSIDNFWYDSISLSMLPLHFISPKNEIIKYNSSILASLKKIKENQQNLSEIIKKSDISEVYVIPLICKKELVGNFIFSPRSNIINNTDEVNLKIVARVLASTILLGRQKKELDYRKKQRTIQDKLFNLLSRILAKEELLNLMATEINTWIPTDFIGVFAGSNDYDKRIVIGQLKTSGNNYKTIQNTNELSNAFSNMWKYFKNYEEYFIEFREEKLEQVCKKSTFLAKLKSNYSINSLIIIRFILSGKGNLYLVLGRTKPIISKQINNFLFDSDIDSYFSNEEINLAYYLLPQVGMLLGFFFMFEEITILTKKLEQEKSYLIEEINLTNIFQEIIGNSSAIQKTLNKVEQVAPLDATVLIQGETGTGKELIAKAIHNLSKRKTNAFITINCAALPATLIESELFGHEKGSFTGAIEKKIGKFEIADGGTIFLDEIGELPIELQSKLLRVIQTKTFERIGGKQTIKSDVRIIAATNRNLEKEIANGRFRSDLYFRLNVFPIFVPSLKERKEDIPALVKHFINIYSKRIGSNVKSIKKTDLELLTEYNWPGNIRELEHLIERSIIISKGENINFENFFKSIHTNSSLQEEDFATLTEIEKQHIVLALKKANGKITGKNSASELLGINGKTLGSKIRKLGIKKEINFNIN